MTKLLTTTSLKGLTAKAKRALRKGATFVQRKRSDTWHWIRECEKVPFPENIAKEQVGQPRSGELCNECVAKERDA